MSFSDIDKIDELAPGVSIVCVASNMGVYVFKEIDRPLYEPRDTEILQQELRNLEVLNGVEFIVELFAPVVSPNPYQTDATEAVDQDRVLRGMLLEYHPNGTLQDTLRSPDQAQNGSWQKWALHIALGLGQLHSRGITHMDLKPANIVRNAVDNAVLIDISGKAFTQEWLSRELYEVTDPCSQIMI